ncbi:MAG TPA: choice-of-anchor Q domain-containing protein [Rudaea sp.]
MTVLRPSPAPRRRPLAACCAALFALATPEAFAGIVTSCADDGSAGTLRSAIAGAASGDTIDMSGLNSCSLITLNPGELPIPQASLILQGPTTRDFLIEGNLYHSGTGTLSINNLTLAFGNAHHRPYSVNGGPYGSPLPGGVYGGCVYSKGSAVLSHTNVIGCQAFADTSKQYEGARGGGVIVARNLTLLHSTVSFNSVDATSNAGGLILGGGVCVEGNFVAKYSTIDSNSAGSASGNHSNLVTGGGVEAVGNASLYETTVSRNTSAYSVGGIHILGAGVGNAAATITNSTISGNDAPSGGGLFSNISANISNSTIAFNTKHAASGYAAGAAFTTFARNTVVNLHSTIIANNTCSGCTHPNDDLGAFSADANYTVTFPTDAQQGNFNLIRTTEPSVPGSSLPPDTIVLLCPLLGPLKNNGGETWTHALYSGSVAIDGGVNALGLYYDQRGGPQPPPNTIPPPPLAYDRHSGVRTDIGAFEYQYSDTIFNAGFEGCPALF